jgi:hypothetical protein
MADQTTVHIGENSPEEVAYKLLKIVASNEGKTLQYAQGAPATADRSWLLDTYAECLRAVRRPSDRAT